MSEHVRSPRHNWTSLHSRRVSKCGAHYLHVSGWEVKHCGHPTANWPYYATAPTGESPVIADCGKAFMTVRDALDAVESVLRGSSTLKRVESDKYGYVWLVVESDARGAS